MSTIKRIIAFFTLFAQILLPLGAYLKPEGEKAFFTQWSETDTFDSADYVEIKKTPGKDFVILNLTDVQLNDELQFEEEGEFSEKIIRKLVAEQNPDLITLSGDNAWATLSYLKLIELIESFDIPWAPVMGNHDGERCINEFWAAYHLADAENCLFRFGPEGMGYGNYIINITENGEIIHTLFMMDTHEYATKTLDDGTTQSIYNHLWENQIAWYKWGVKGIETLAGHIVDSTVIMHVPVPEFADAWESVCVRNEGEKYGTIDPQYADIAFGYRYGGVSETIENNFFEVCKELGSTKNIIVGHHHTNSFSVPYEGIRLTFAVKSGLGSSWRADSLGGTTLTVDSDGSTQTKQHFINLEELGYNVTAY